MTRIVLVEDHHMVREGLRRILESERDFELVGEAADGLTAVEMVERHRPDVLVMDLMIPRLHGLELARRVSAEFKETRMLVLSMHADEPYVVEALRSGALGYVLKDSSGSDLVAAVRAVAVGRRYLSPELADKAIAGYIRPEGDKNADPIESLTKRERLVLQLAAEGMTSAEIAAKLFISPRTAETHRANLMRKLNLKSQTDLVRLAIRKGIIEA